MQRALLTGLIAALAVPVCLAASENEGVLGVAIAPEFNLNGSQVPDNANLIANSEIVSLSQTVRIHLKNDCDYLLAPSSAARIADQKLILERGKVRAERSGACKMAAGSWIVWGDTPKANGVISYSGKNLEVASLAGTLNVADSHGMLAGAVVPGVSASFAGGQTGTSGASQGPSGATASSGAGASKHSLAIYGTTLAVTLAGLGLAVDAILQPGSPTSP